MHESALKELSGEYQGQKVAIRTYLPVSPQDCNMPDDILMWGKKQIKLGSNLTPTLARLMPNGYLANTPKTNDAQAWACFIDHANRHNLFQ